MDVSARDLAPGDRKSADLDLALWQIDRVPSIAHPLFEMAYGALWEAFGSKGELESRAVLAGRFALPPSMLYELILVRREGRLAAVRDHTAMAVAGEVVVHLSHNLVTPEWRRSGLAGWLRALPLGAARRCGRTNQLGPECPVTLVGEMEYGEQPENLVRLRAYEKAGFRKVDPAVVSYFQPDFRAPEEIDAAGGAAPLPFQLVIRQVGREGEETIATGRVRMFIGALYALYGAQFRRCDMEHPDLLRDACGSCANAVALLPPSEGRDDGIDGAPVFSSSLCASAPLRYKNDDGITT